MAKVSLGSQTIVEQASYNSGLCTFEICVADDTVMSNATDVVMKNQREAEKRCAVERDVRGAAHDPECRRIVRD